MIVTGKCPKCEKVANNPKIENVEIGDKFAGPLYRGVNIKCAHCHTILGSAIDPMWLESRIVAGVLEGLGVKPKNRR